MSVMSRPRWPHQQLALDQTEAARRDGLRRVVVVSPTGGGKTRMQFDLIQQTLARGQGALVLSNRRMLLAQHGRNARACGFRFGFRAANHRELVSAVGMEFGFHRGDRMHDRKLQLAMTQSECQRVLKNGEPLHDCGLVIVDEAHLHRSPSIVELLGRYQDAGAFIVGYTATPVDLAPVGYDRLIVAGSNAELRACGALVPALIYAPDQPENYPDIAANGELSEQQVMDAMFGTAVQLNKQTPKPRLIGRVFEKWRELNPDALPTLLFAPSVAASIWFAEAFHEAGFRSAHIDGENIWIDGQMQPSTTELRDNIAEQHRNGELAVICNRFVLREGIDWGWIRHGIFATMFGGIASFLQSGGRLLRSFPGKKDVIVQDHGGNYWRHGSLNADREWILGESNYEVTRNRFEAMRQAAGDPNADPKDREPVVCPKCHRARPDTAKYASQCPHCGHFAAQRSRTVLTAKGELKEIAGNAVKPRKVSLQSDTEKKWLACYFRAKASKKGMTFRQAEALFIHENHYAPPRNLPLMPKNQRDWARRVRSVSASDLIPKQG